MPQTGAVVHHKLPFLLFHVGHPLKDGDGIPVVVGDPDVVNGVPSAPGDLFRFGIKRFSFSGLDESNGRVQGDGEPAVGIRGGRKGHVRQGEEHSTVNTRDAVEMVLLNVAFYRCPPGRYALEFDPCMNGEFVSLEKMMPSAFIRHGRATLPVSSSALSGRVFIAEVCLYPGGFVKAEKTGFLLVKRKNNATYPVKNGIIRRKETVSLVVDITMYFEE